MRFVLIVCLTVSAIQNLSAQLSWVCEEGVPYKENSCNECGCANGKLYCTYMFCHDSAELQNCVNGTISQKECNCCRCVRDEEFEGTICTNYDCETSEVKCTI